MKINDIGGEFALIERLAAIAPGRRPEVIQGIGDDAAVLRVAPEPAPYLVVTTDLLVENRHFNRAWARPEQIGRKASECNVSDIAAMGGTPQWMFVSLVLPWQTEVAWIEGVYRGLGASCSEHGIALLGGDTTRGDTVVISITLIGSVAPDHLCLRSAARPGDLLMVTGSLGASAAGLALLERQQPPSAYLLEKHLTPHCRMDVSKMIAPLANAMIDISDGLGAEVRHICRQSGVGAEIDAPAIPLHEEVRQAGRILGVDPLSWALGGGEDFELLFSISADNAEKLRQQGVECFQLGKVTADPNTIVLHTPSGDTSDLSGGYNHFS